MVFGEQIMIYAHKLHKKANKYWWTDEKVFRLGDTIDRWCHVAVEKGLATPKEVYQEDAV